MSDLGQVLPCGTASPMSTRWPQKHLSHRKCSICISEWPLHKRFSCQLPMKLSTCIIHSYLCLPLHSDLHTLSVGLSELKLGYVLHCVGTQAHQKFTWFHFCSPTTKLAQLLGFLDLDNLLSFLPYGQPFDPFRSIVTYWRRMKIVQTAWSVSQAHFYKLRDSRQSFKQPVPQFHHL